jgi:hypothetical protein
MVVGLDGRDPAQYVVVPLQFGVIADRWVAGCVSHRGSLTRAIEPLGEQPQSLIVLLAR